MTIEMRENKKHDGAYVTLIDNNTRFSVYINYLKFATCEIYTTEDYKSNNDRARLSYYKNKISVRIINISGKCANIVMCNTMDQAQALKDYINQLA